MMDDKESAKPAGKAGNPKRSTSVARRSPDISRRPSFDFPLDLRPMEAHSAASLPTGPGWQFEPKWDGFRCLAFKAGDAVELRSKSGKALGRYFPEIESLLRRVPADRFVIDGELVIVADGRPSFADLQMRLHPAESRIRKLVAATPANFILFDMLSGPDGSRIIDQPLIERRSALERFGETIAELDGLTLSPFTRARRAAVRWLEHSGGETDGVIAKRLDDRYRPGERAAIKVKRVRTADCVVGGFRYGSDGGVVGSLLLGLYDDAGLLDHVGFTSALTNDERPALTRRLEAMREAPGFTGRSPGGPSRWSTDRSEAWEPVRPELVVEVRFDQVTGARFRHGTTLLRWRPDKAPRQCTLEQIESRRSP
jgi:ATP-dependent DNA ligase